MKKKEEKKNGAQGERSAAEEGAILSYFTFIAEDLIKELISNTYNFFRGRKSGGWLGKSAGVVL